MPQEHIKTLSALTSNGHAVNLMNGCVNDLSGAAMEVLKEMKVSIYAVLLISWILGSVYFHNLVVNGIFFFSIYKWCLKLADDVLRCMFGFKIQKLQQMDLYDEHTRMRRRLLNDRLLLAERSFLQPEGLQGRGWFKHLVRKRISADLTTCILFSFKLKLVLSPVVLASGGLRKQAVVLPWDRGRHLTVGQSE